MSNELVPITDAQIPAHLKDRIGAESALATSMAGGISGELVPRISIKGSRFRIIEEGTETVLPITFLDVVVVGANPKLSKSWFEKAWNPNDEPTQADCFSMNGVGPDPDSSKPQNNLCATCAQNAWGSKVTPDGKKIKACADQKRLAIVAADDPTGTIYLLQVTPAALRGLNAYQKTLSVRGISPEIVKTRIEFDTDASYPKLMFSFAGFLDEDVQTEVDKLFGTEAVVAITGEGRTEPVTTSDPEPETPAVEPTPEPAVVQEEEAGKVVGFGAAKAAAKKAAKAAEEPAQAQNKTEAVSEEPAPVEVTPDAKNLADEIAALVGEADDGK